MMFSPAEGVGVEPTQPFQADSFSRRTDLPMYQTFRIHSPLSMYSVCSGGTSRSGIWQMSQKNANQGIAGQMTPAKIATHVSRFKVRL
jgi:hypothetical protein